MLNVVLYELRFFKYIALYVHSYMNYSFLSYMNYSFFYEIIITCYKLQIFCENCIVIYNTRLFEDCYSYLVRAFKLKLLEFNILLRATRPSANSHNACGCVVFENI